MTKAWYQLPEASSATTVPLMIQSSVMVSKLPATWRSQLLDGGVDGEAGVGAVNGRFKVFFEAGAEHEAEKQGLAGILNRFFIINGLLNCFKVEGSASAGAVRWTGPGPVTTALPSAGGWDQNRRAPITKKLVPKA